MPVVAQQPQKGGRNCFQSIFLPNSLSPSRPTSKKRTVVRLIPEIAPDGSIKPTVQAITPVGPDISNLALESTTVMAGLSHKWTGLNRPSDVAVASEFDMIFPGAYIRLKSMLTKNKPFPTSDLKLKVMEMTAKNEHGGSAFSRPSPLGYLQCVVTEFNSEVLAKPYQYQCLILTEAAVRQLSNLISEYHKKGEDVFSPSRGRFLIIDGIPPGTEGNKTATWMFNLKFGDVIPLTESQCRALWVPWDKVFARTTYKDQFLSFVKAFGTDIAKFTYPELFEQYYVPTTVAAPATPVAAPAAAPVQRVAATPAAAVTSQPSVAVPPKGLELDLSVGVQALPGVDDEPEEAPAAPSVPAPGKTVTAVANATAHKPPSVAELESQITSLLGADADDEG